jgi:hypothetical protein
MSTGGSVGSERVCSSNDEIISNVRIRSRETWVAVKQSEKKEGCSESMAVIKKTLNPRLEDWGRNCY